MLETTINEAHVTNWDAGERKTAEALKATGDMMTISDFEYDMLMVELRNLEKQHPEFITNDSPTQVIVASGKHDEKFSEVVHKVPLQSLQDIFSFEELREFDAASPF